ATQEPILLVAAALAGVTAPDLLARASDRAVSTRDRQVVAIAAAHLDGDSDRVAVLARDHLVDHPGNLLVAWIAAACSATARPQPEQLTRPLHHPKEM
ncbi:MAG TPA: hypothetical protein VHN80_14840, partial [Kineosporiaceae bacterium]|nr:hypothetical protein [Kineosporiaceae bacterium]